MDLSKFVLVQVDIVLARLSIQNPKTLIRMQVGD
jgi:hypothetical protein